MLHPRVLLFTHVHGFVAAGPYSQSYPDVIPGDLRRISRNINFVGDAWISYKRIDYVAEQDAGPNDEERDQPRVRRRTLLARSSSSVSFAFGGVAMLRFENQDDFVEIDIVSQETDDLPSRGDAYLTIRVSAAGFAGHNDLWVLAPALRSFCQALVTLERDRRGEALLGAVSPRELRLVVRSVDSRGHMAVEGSTGYEVQRENSRPWHSVDFGFEFDPSQLLRAVGVDWVRRNAEPGGAANRGQPIGSETNQKSAAAGPGG